MRDSYIARLSAKFQIVIPKVVRDAKGWKAGQEFAFTPKGDGVWIVPVPKPGELAGLARNTVRKNVRNRADRF